MQQEKNGKLGVVIQPEKDGQQKRRKSFWRINKKTLPFKLHFFLFIGAMGAVLPYQSAFGITRLGLTASNLAAAYTTQQFFIIIIKPFIGYLADYFNKLKATIFGLTVIQALFCLGMILIPSINVENISYGIQPQLNISLDEFRNCQLCNYYQELKMISSDFPVNESILKQAISCFEISENYTDNSLIYCPKQKADSLHSNDIDYQILHKTCINSIDNNNISSLNNSMLPNSYKNFVSLISPQSNSTQNTHFLCIHPESEKTSFNESNIKLRKEQCHSMLDEEYSSLTAMLSVSFLLPKYVNCETVKLNVILPARGEYNAALSAANFKAYQFWLFFLCLMISCACNSAIFTMSDTACYESIQKTGADYGRTRAWGAISWGVIAPFAGFLNDYTDNYLVAWCVMALLCSLQIWNMSKMDLVKPDLSQSILKDLKTVFKSFEFIAFEVGVFMNGLLTGIIWFYLTWFITVIGGNKLVVGLAHTVQCFLGEVPFMFYSGWVIKKLGHFNIVSLALFTHGVRFLIYSYIHNAWWILPVECVHGITFGIFYSAMTSYGKLNSKPGTEATTQSVLCTTYEGFGAGLGCVIFGICFDRFGTHTTFFYAFFIGMLATGINLLFTLMIRFRKGRLEVTQEVATKSQRY